MHNLHVHAIMECLTVTDRKMNGLMYILLYNKNEKKSLLKFLLFFFITTIQKKSLQI